MYLYSAMYAYNIYYRLVLKDMILTQKVARIVCLCCAQIKYQMKINNSTCWAVKKLQWIGLNYNKMSRDNNPAPVHNTFASSYRNKNSVLD